MIKFLIFILTLTVSTQNLKAEKKSVKLLPFSNMVEFFEESEPDYTQNVYKIQDIHLKPDNEGGFVVKVTDKKLKELLTTKEGWGTIMKEIIIDAMWVWAYIEGKEYLEDEL